ncbi:phage holin family protein [Arsenicicoccus piscis]|uniref:Phage holin family protein n=1 Tax=Arsenicicoccus piscis TaxID=673954 RepID=A0ABQ6HRU3_9MICO|nr:phage holin family protein [Arsenicicoccus piscis]MCH8626544.1 phage holin family protein [Arsenicicoccus piscis]GMA21190.1 hypothetical protein GCM10025862_32110 [Arsenicicoccus piscis]
MRSFAIKTVVNAIALGAAALVVSGIHLGEEANATSTRLLSMVLVAVVFGLVNAVLKPIVVFFSLPAIILTLGLFTWVVNALMLQVTSWLAGPLGLDFHVDHFFWDALLGSIVITLVAMILNVLLPDSIER